MKINELNETKFGLSNKQRQAYAKKVSTKLDDDVDAALEKYGPQIAVALKAFKEGRRIFRGVPSEARALLVDPTKVERKAANTFNYMNIMQATLPSWKAYPRRNRSLICTTSYSTAAAYGFDGRFAVLPFGDPMVGIVPGDDWFRAFAKYGGPQYVNSNLANFYASMHEIQSGFKKPLPETKPQFYEAIKEMDNWRKFHKDEAEEIMREHPADNFIKDLMKYPNWIDGLNELLDPAKNGFKMVPLSKFKPERDIEVWISAPALFIHGDDLMQRFKVDKKSVK